ncbi:MAG: hypothetical protein J6U42_02850 [Lachnospiraceae bacterium]|nr:hypothetical protein [Lachnospiraceae bacterium]
MKILKDLFNGFIIAGVVIFMIGVYYAVVKAGIPYQDPTLELQIKYAVNSGIGSVLLRTGGIVGVIGGVFRIVTGIVSKKKG